MKIAIIDDVRIMRDSLKEEILKIKKVDISVFEFGNDFLKDEKKYDIIFLDGMLIGDISSRELLEKILEKNPNEYVVLFGGASLEDIPEWIELGIKGALGKPIDKDNLIKVFYNFENKKH